MASSNSQLSSSLPFVLIEEILYRTPADSLLRFKSTCKQWNDLINDKNFIYKNLEHSQERFIRTEYDQKVYIMDPVTEIPSVSPIPIALRDRYPIYSMINCDGLLLCSCVGLNDGFRRLCKLAVWNPILRKLKWIELMVRSSGTDYFGIGYDKKHRDRYKILYFPHPQPAGGYDTSEPMCKIYEFIKSGEWRMIDAKFDKEVETRSEGVSVKGNTYWIAVKKKKDHVIISFDFSKETFKEICVCPNNGWKRFGCFNRDGLSLLQHDEGTGNIHVWVTNKLSDEVVSFSKFFDVVSPDLRAFQFHDVMASPGYFIGKHKNITAWYETVGREGGRGYICINLYKVGKGGVRNKIETGRFDASMYFVPLTRCCVFLPSLIPVPKRRG